MSSTTLPAEKTLTVKGIDAHHEESDTTTSETTERDDTAVVAELSTVKTELSTARHHSEKDYGPDDMVKVFVPVSICMTIVIVCTRNMEIYQRDIIIRTPYVIYHDPEAEPSTKLWHSVVNAVALLCTVIVTTFGVLCLFYFKFYRCLNGFLMFATFSLITVMTALQYHEILRAMNVPVSIVTVLLVHLNLAAIGMMSIFWKGPLKVQQGTLVIMAAMVTLTIMRVFPKWTSWAVVITLAFWDLFAVLSPCGPLRMLVNIAEERDQNLNAAMIYTGAASVTRTEPTRQSAASEERSKEKQVSEPSGRAIESLRMPNFSSSDDDERNIRLGLGDFIFYSLLVGNATVLADLTTILACFVSILVGLGFTLVLLVIVQKALPALPISIAFGAIAFFSSNFVTSKYLDQINKQQIFL